MRIALVSEHASPLAAIGGIDAGGQNVHVAELAARLAARGHDVVVHTRRDAEELPAQVRVDGYVVDHVDAGPPTAVPKDELPPHMAALGDGLRRRWDAAPPDVVHAHYWMSGLAALRGARRMGIPVVQTFHALGCVKRRHQGEDDTSPPERIERETDLARTVDRVVATCSDEVFELRRMGAGHRRVSVVPCGVDVARFTPRQGERPDGPVRVLAASRLVPRKGLDDLLRAIATVPGAELHLAGGPPTGFDADPEVRRLRALAGELGLGERLRFLGPLGRDAMIGAYRDADLVACPAWYEPFGLVPLEAMACGVPIVATAVGGHVDSVVHGETGLHVPPHDPAALAEAVAELAGDAQLRARLGAAGRDRVLQRFDWERVADATLEVYATLGAGRNRLAASR